MIYFVRNRTYHPLLGLYGLLIIFCSQILPPGSFSPPIGVYPQTQWLHDFAMPVWDGQLDATSHSSPVSLTSLPHTAPPPPMHVPALQVWPAGQGPHSIMHTGSGPHANPVQSASAGQFTGTHVPPSHF